MCPYALSPDSTELQAGDVSMVGVGQQNIVGAALTTCLCFGEQQIAKQLLQRVRDRKTFRGLLILFLSFYDAALFVMDTTTEECTE